MEKTGQLNCNDYWWSLHIVAVRTPYSIGYALYSLAMPAGDHTSVEGFGAKIGLKD
jgi:hypothetical protein